MFLKKTTVVGFLLIVNTAFAQSSDGCEPVSNAQSNAIQARMVAIDNFAPYQSIAQNRSLMQQCMSAMSNLTVGNVQTAGYTGIGAYISRAIQGAEGAACNAALSKYNQMVGSITQAANGALSNLTSGVTGGISQATGGAINGSSLIPNTSGMISGAINTGSQSVVQGVSNYFQSPTSSLDSISQSLAPSVAAPLQ